MSTPSATDSSKMLSKYLSQLEDAKNDYLKADTAFRNIRNRPPRGYSASGMSVDDREFDRRADEQYKQISKSLGAVCDAVRSASQSGQLLHDDLDHLVERAALIEDTIMELSHSNGDEGSTDIACGNVLKDESAGSQLANSVGAGTMRMLMPFVHLISKMAAKEATGGGTSSTESGGLSKEFIDELFLGSSATSYRDTPRPSACTSPLARFAVVPQIPRLDVSPSTLAFVEARCEIQSDSIGHPVDMRLTGDTLATLIEEYLLIGDISINKPGSSVYGREQSYYLGKRSGPQMALDETRKLVYNGTNKAINAYRYGPDQYGDRTFSLKTREYQGLLALTADGAKVLRTGKKGLGVWDISSVGSHGSEASFSTVNSEAFAEIADFGVWAQHPSQSQERLVGSREHSCFVSSVDLESGRVASRYIGHNKAVSGFASSVADAHSFLTASSDGGVRFYDSRMPVPVYAIAHTDGGDDIQAVLYEHIGGHPFIIIGGHKTQQIKVWDARGRAPLYRLSSGNNAVEALAWDASRNQLFAATSCEYIGYNGTASGYREAQFGEDDRGRAWPKQAYHDEESFGYPFDSGSHRLLRYSFKAESDTSVLPVYGCAQPDYGGGGGLFDF